MNTKNDKNFRLQAIFHSLVSIYIHIYFVLFNTRQCQTFKYTQTLYSYNTVNNTGDNTGGTYWFPPDKRCRALKEAHRLYPRNPY